MNSVDKPKKVKLWKNSGGTQKKQKIQKQPISDEKLNGEENVATSPKKAHKNIKSEENTNEKWEFYKKFKKEMGEDAKEAETSPNLKRKNEAPVAPNAKKIKTENLKIKNESPNAKKIKTENLKIKNEAPNAKKVKPDNMTRKEWKLLGLNKKSKLQAKEPAQETAEVKDAAKSGKKGKMEHRTGKEWKKLHKEQKGKMEQFEVGKVLKSLWEELRRESCKPEKKDQLLKQACDLLKGRMKEFTFAHDTARVLECILSEGAENHRTLLFDELKSDILNLSKSKYGKFCVLKMLKYGTKTQREEIMKTFHGLVIQLIRHTEAAEVLEFAFNECANATQRHELTQEFYGPTYKFFKSTEFRTLNELFEKDPDKKVAVINHMKEELLKVLDKSVVKHSIVHNVLWQFMVHADPISKAEVIESLREAVPLILHTKDGSRAALHCVWFGTLKDRKVIVKSMKTFVVKIAMEEHGHLVLLALFDCVDDTKFLSQKIIGELKTQLLELSQSIHGKKVLIYLLNPRDPHYIHPGLIQLLQTGDGNETSKKDPEIRRSELKAVIAQPLLDLVKSNIQKQYTDNPFCLFAVVVLAHTVGDRTEAFQAIAELVIEPYTTDNKKTHPVEHAGANFMFKQLILHDKTGSAADGVTFSEVLIKTVPKLVFKSWMECNRGAFLLVSLLETELPSVVERIKEELTGCKKYLAKKPFKGAEILIKKLKE